MVLQVCFHYKIKFIFLPEFTLLSGFPISSLNWNCMPPRNIFVMGQKRACQLGFLHIMKFRISDPWNNFQDHYNIWYPGAKLQPAFAWNLNHAQSCVQKNQGCLCPGQTNQHGPKQWVKGCPTATGPYFWAHKLSLDNLLLFSLFI